MISGNGLPIASVSASCISVTPPPEYLKAVNGGRSISTGPTFDGLLAVENLRRASGAAPTGDSRESRSRRPGRTCGSSSARGVTGWPRVNSPSGSFHDFRIVLMSCVEREPARPAPRGARPSRRPAC